MRAKMFILLTISNLAILKDLQSVKKLYNACKYPLQQKMPSLMLHKSS